MSILEYVLFRTRRVSTSIAAGAFMLVASGTAGAVTIPLQSYGTGVPGDGNAWTLNVSLGGTTSNPLANFTFIKVASDDTQGEFGLNQILFEVGLGSILTGPPAFSYSGGVLFELSLNTNGALPDEPALVPSNPWGDDDYSGPDLDDNFARFVAERGEFGKSLKDLDDAVTIRYGYSGTLDDLVSSLLDFSGNRRIAVRLGGPETVCVSGACGLAAAPLAPVPLPAAAWLLLSALLGLAASARRAVGTDSGA
ncbi:MAG: hypothetical protein NFCOHLIN_02869 [Gammaproteobacteria bacterium]|nr:hypothetical protein [Gammaproteobacteria bacterium]